MHPEMFSKFTLRRRILKHSDQIVKVHRFSPLHQPGDEFLRMGFSIYGSRTFGSVMMYKPLHGLD